MTILRSVLIYLVICCAFISSCVSKNIHLSSDPTTPADTTELLNETTPEFTPNQIRLENLPPPTHSVSISGPGWHEIPLTSVLASAGLVTPHDANELPLMTTDTPAYALFGTGDFDGDCGPTSARLTMHSNTGEYYVGFSDYDNGSWLFNGPFAGPATVEIPNNGEYSYGSSFVSDRMWTYLLVVVPAGSALNLSHVELGIHGGANAPRAPSLSSPRASAEIVQLTWIPSPDSHRPDFAGYIIERAPRYYGDYSELTPELVTGTYYLDTTAQENILYRYRLSAVDTNGNRGLSSAAIGGLNPETQTRPVPVVDFPDGPLYGPVEIDFDMSGSFDPEGELIDDYSLTFVGNLPAISGSDPVKTVTVQPGCYVYVLTVTAGTRTGTVYGSFKVYPTWRDTPATAVSNPETNYRGTWLCSGIHPATGDIVHGYIDNATHQFRLVAVNETGQATYHSVDTYGGGLCLQNPLVYQDNLLFCIQGTEYIQIITFDGNEARVTDKTYAFEHNIPGLATDGQRVWMVVCREDDSVLELQVMQTHPTGIFHYVVENTGGINWIDAEYNEVEDALDIVYTISLSQDMYWVRDNLDDVPDTPVEICPGANASSLEMVVNPANGRPMVLYLEASTNRYMFTALQSDLTTWTAPEVVDDSLNNQSISRLILNDGYPTALIGLADGSVNVYRRVAGWSKTNTFLDGPGMMTVCSLTKDPGYPGVIATYRPVSENLVTYRADLDGTNNLVWTESKCGPLGSQLHGAAASDGIHFVYRDQTVGARHYSSLDGAFWSELPDFSTLGNLDLVTTADGEMYLSYYYAGNAHLDWWDGSAWSSVETNPTDADHRPLLNSIYRQDSVRYSVYNPSTSQMLCMLCKHGELPSLYYSPTCVDVWAGQQLHGNRTVQWQGSSNPAASHGYLGEWGQDLGILLLVTAAKRLFVQNDYVTNRIMASGTYLHAEDYYPSAVCWVASSDDGLPFRFEISDYIPQNFTTLDLGAGTDADETYTVSAMETPGYTTVGLIANTTGEYSRLEWSNFGDWEELPVPDCLEHMMSPEVVCGPDGRWHIIYRDWVNDNIMCLSTE